jgi:hypothetical protein
MGKLVLVSCRLSFFFSVSDSFGSLSSCIEKKGFHVMDTYNMDEGMPRVSMCVYCYSEKYRSHEYPPVAGPVFPTSNCKSVAVKKKKIT